MKTLPQTFQLITFWAAVSKFYPLSLSHSQIAVVILENREFKYSALAEVKTDEKISMIQD